MFWEIFVRLCMENGVKPNPVAKAVGVKSTGTVSAWKNGVVPHDTTLLALANYFGVTVDFLLGATPESYLMATQYRLTEAEKAYEKETDEAKKAELALEIDGLRESIADQKLASKIVDIKKAPLPKKEREELSDDGHHVGVLYDRADEKDQMLTHGILDKYETEETASYASATENNPGRMIELDVFDQPAAAGLGNYLDAPECSRQQFPAFMIPKGADFGIRISGDSMEPYLKDGMVVFVKQTITLEPKKVGIFVLNGAAYCKQLIVDREKKEVRLHSLNTEYEDIVIAPGDTLRTIGQVL